MENIYSDSRALWDCLNTAQFGILSVDGQQSVPVLFCFYEDRIYINGYLDGQLMIDPKNLGRVGFKIPGTVRLSYQDRQVQEYNSLQAPEDIQVFGYARIVEDRLLKEQALLCILKKYMPRFPQGDLSSGAMEQTVLLEIVPENSEYLS